MMKDLSLGTVYLKLHVRDVIFASNDVEERLKNP